MSSGGAPVPAGGAPSVVCVGEITVDRYLNLGRGQVDMVGGISLNVAVNARRCGAARVGLVSCVGDDAGGALARAKLAREGVDQARVRTLPGETARQDIQVLAGGERLFPPGGYHAGVLADMRLDAEDLAYVRAFDIAIVPVFRQIEHIARAVLADRAPGTCRAADFLDGADLGPDLGGIAEFLPLLDIAFVSGDAGTADRLAPLAGTARALIVVTLGAAGSVALTPGGRVFQPAIHASAPLDTTGAGDAFQAAFTLAYLGGGDVRHALALGAERASQVIRHYGATDDR